MVNSKESDEVLDHANNIGSASEDEVRGMCWISAQNYWDDNLILMLLFKVFSVAVDPLIDWLFAVSFTLLSERLTSILYFHLDLFSMRWIST